MTGLGSSLPVFTSLEKWVVGTAAILLAVGISASSDSTLQLFIVGGLAGICGARWVVDCPEGSLLLLLVAGLTVSYSIPTSSATGLSPTLVIIGGLTSVWLFVWLRQDWRELYAQRVFRALLAFCFVSVVAFLAGLEPLDPFAESAPLRAQAGQLAVILLSAFAMVFASFRIRTLRWIEVLCYAFLGLVAVYILGRLVPGLGLVTRYFFPSGATGALFWVWAASLSAGQAVFNRDMKGLYRLLFLALGLAVVSVAFFQARAWASGWLPACAAIGIILVLARPWVAVTGTLLAGGVLFWKLEALKSLLVVGDQWYSLVTRIEAARLLLDYVWQVSPLLGFGPANYYFYASTLDILGWHVRFSSHNNFVDIFAQTGLLGLGCFLWFVCEVAVLGWRLLRSVSDGFSSAFIAGSLAGLLGTLTAALLGDWFLPFVFNVTMEGMRASILGWVFLGCLVALNRMVGGRGVEVGG